MKQDYTLFTRKVGGKTVYYYYAYDENGTRRKFSTGQTTKAAAVNYCNRRLELGELIPPTSNKIIFRNFAAGFWDWGKSTYIKRLIARGGSFSRSYSVTRTLIVNRHIIPYFGDMKLSEIRPRAIENWLFGFIDRGLAAGTANHARTTLKLMLDEAVRLEYLAVNPCDKVKPLIKHPKERGILTLKEAYELLHPDNYAKYWDNPLSYAGNLLAALTGLRAGEVRGLQVSDLFYDHITVNYSEGLYGLKDTKTHRSRPVPIIPLISQVLEKVRPDQGYVLSPDNGKSPLKVDCMIDSLYRALERMGISKQERKERNICFHSWRHFFNTSMRAGNISDAKTQAITGHSTLGMTERYTHFTHEDLKEVNKIQIAIIEGVGA